MTAQIHIVKEADPNPTVTAMLENYLERARAGEFASMVVVFMDRDGCTGASHSTVPSVSALVGGMERAKFDLIEEWR